MSEEEVVEAVARAICRANCRPQMTADEIECQVHSAWDMWKPEARAAIEAARPMIEADTLEKAARLADEYAEGNLPMEDTIDIVRHDEARGIATAIRQLGKGGG